MALARIYGGDYSYYSLTLEPPRIIQAMGELSTYFLLQGEDGIPLDDLIGLGGDFKSPGGDNRGPPPPSQPPGGGGGGYPPPSGGGGGGGGYPAAQYPPEPAVAYPPQNMPQQTPVVYPTPQPSYPPQNTDPA